MSGGAAINIDFIYERYIKPYLDAATTLRDQGQAVIDELETNPAVRQLLETFRGLFDKPVSKIRQEDVDALTSWYAEATAKSKPMVDTPPPPPPPPPPMQTFRFGDVLSFDPRNRPDFKPEHDLWQSKVAPTKFIVTDGKIGSGTPNALFPTVIVNDGEEVGGGWEKVD